MLTSLMFRRTVAPQFITENPIHNMIKTKQRHPFIYKEVYIPSVPNIFSGFVDKQNDDDNVVAIQINQLKKGDKIINSQGKVSEIICVVKTPVDDSVCRLVDINGVKVTKSMPVNINNKSDQNYTGTWVLAKNAGMSCDCYCDYLFNFVLDNDHIMTVNNVDVGIVESKQIIDKLMNESGWKHGLIVNSDKFFE